MYIVQWEIFKLLAQFVTLVATVIYMFNGCFPSFDNHEVSENIAQTINANNSQPRFITEKYNTIIQTDR